MKIVKYNLRLQMEGDVPRFIRVDTTLISVSDILFIDRFGGGCEIKFRNGEKLTFHSDIYLEIIDAFMSLDKWRVK